jgi:hypothetical protein
MERKVEQVFHSTFGYVQDVAAFCEASGCDRVRRPVRQNRGRGDWTLDARAEAHGAVFHLFEEVGFATTTTEPEVFHATRGSFAICRCRPRHVEYVDPPLAEVMEGLAALRIRAMVDHGGDPSSEATAFPCSAVYLLDCSCVARRESCAPDIFLALRYMIRMLLKRHSCL